MESSRDGAAPLELWGGVECTVNRLGGRFLDQVERSGHGRRLGDLDAIAALGLRTLRYPVIWERHAPLGLEAADWSWADERLARLRALGVSPIAGLLHHGSGPRGTALDDPRLGEKLARYAGAVARRYPWIEAYVPVNEPLTTARFSFLYGLWYPHAADPPRFARAMLRQCRAVALAMRAIRAVNPAAKLIQTEDLCRVHSTRPLAYQAEFENHRRWLTFDLLCGRFTPAHPLWGYFRWLGLAEREMGWLADNPCPPDVLGVNYYVTSERFLDHRLDRYPEHTHGGNGRHRYADVEAVRARPGGLVGLGALLRECWGRYNLPIAVTEVHLACAPDEQKRWLWEAWCAARLAREAGADVRAITAWSLLGAYDWDSLLTCEAGRYEPGVFDVRSGEAVRTPLAALAADLAAGRTPDLRGLERAGWWRRASRIELGGPPGLNRQAAKGRQDRKEAPAAYAPLARPAR